uniref:DnaD/phage-associated protein n=1 Tax=uncultured bacterium F25-01 TaxID=1191433 RepID=I3VIF5_9BACT|nr:DnaD/phage-associated protein [uncultured bacterium F25-01]
MPVPFAGFPDGSLAATVIPSVFFAEALGSIGDLGELKLILYLFWRIGQRRPAPRFFRRADLEADSAIRAGLGSGGTATLAASLDRLVADKLVLHRTVEQAGQIEDWYFLNTSAGRRAVDDLEAGTLVRGVISRPEEPLQVDRRSSIFLMYEQNIGLLTPLIVEELTNAERDYPGDWIDEAFREAVRRNRRSWAYVNRILQRWSVEGKGNQSPGRRAPGSGSSYSVGGGQ